ncbi:LysR family transcriptional regulator [Chondromyces apiculatus]|uniref:Transcriptional regulator, LysR family n=1 Tax=Chondromyces apiculatus DSM 436 TaxID=1192034 RepID=A0A017TAA1_9BACT|nr:LysR family transcriptional regulator [Chondromyces apiculatus]EYF06149.1 Transcriptional regulator, LysR family [Chondromyces apiculatus DSM 436]
MRDLNDLFFFAEVVANGGFAPAGRALQQPKSKLSRRVAQLEERLGVRLIERSSRRFRVTEVGQAFYERCREVMAEVAQAEAIVAEAQGEPHGQVRFSCPTGLLELVSRPLTELMTKYPRVKLHVVATNRRVDLIEERIDVALRVRTSIDTDAALTMRNLGKSRRILVASPQLARRLGDLRDVEALASVTTISSTELSGEVVWDLCGPEGQTRSVRHAPRLACADFKALREVAEAGLGVALLPEHACWLALREGKLVRVLPEWYAPEGIVHLVFTTRRGLPPAVRVFIDHLTERLRDDRLLATGEE